MTRPNQLLRARIRGFKCLADTLFEPGEHLSVLVGDNASGKSSLLEALQLVSDLIRDGARALTGKARGAPGVVSVTVREMVNVGADDLA